MSICFDKQQNVLKTIFGNKLVFVSFMDGTSWPKSLIFIQDFNYSHSNKCLQILTIAVEFFSLNHSSLTVGNIFLKVFIA